MIRCVYCLQEFEKLTNDHVIPRSWYPETTPEGMEKFQVPACNGCNNHFSSIESKLLTVFAYCLSPATEEAAGVSVPVMRSMKPGLASTEKERVHRTKKLENFLKHMEISSKVAISQETIYPGFGTPNNAVYDRYKRPLLMEKNMLEEFICKIVKGLTYRLNQTYIETTHQITIFPPDDNTKSIFDPILERYGNRFNRGPGLSIFRALPAEDPMSSIWKIILWNKFITYATVDPVE